MKSLFPILSYLLIYDSKIELIIWSPSIIISIIYFIKNFLKILKDKTLSAIIVLIFIAITINPKLEYKELLRLIYSIGLYFLSKEKVMNGNNTKNQIILLLTAELILRIFNGDLNEITLYSIKGSGGIFADSNFVGLLIVFAIIGLNNQKNKSNYDLISIYLYILLFLTFSRTAWIMLGTYLIGKKSISASIVILAGSIISPFIINYNEYDTQEVDGSMATKIIIFKTFLHVLNSNLTDILFGLGREIPALISEELEGSSYSGHTIFGQIVQYGLIINLLFYTTAYKLFRKISDNANLIIIILLTGGFLGLSPTSYFGLIFVTYTIFKNNTYLINQKIH